MKRHIAFGCVLVVLASSLWRPAPTPTPTPTPAWNPAWDVRVEALADIPTTMRKENWRGGTMYEGSCVHATMATMLDYHGLHEMARWWERAYGGGEYYSRLVEKLEGANLRWAATFEGDTDFLRYCARNRLPVSVAVVVPGGGHAITMLDFNDTYVVLLDNRSVQEYRYMETKAFLRWWKGSGGIALALIYSPPPPWPLQP